MLTTAVMAGLSWVLPMGTSWATGSVTLSGRVYNGTTGAGYAGVTLDFCGLGTTKTDANGNWQLGLPSGTGYCVRAVSGAPAGVNGPVTRNNPDVGAQSSYEMQIAGVDCYHNASCAADQQKWDRRIDGGLDFVYGLVPTPVPVQPTPAPTPGATPTPTPAPAVLSAPKNFTAKLTDGSLGVDLAWEAADGNPAAYHLERSVDNQRWDVAADSVTDTHYKDNTVLAGVHYYYRLSARAAGGKASDYALADVATGDVLASSAAKDTVYHSDDKVATATVRAETMPDDVTCEVVDSNEGGMVGRRRVITRTYQLACRTTDGQDYSDYKKPISWKLELGNKMEGYTDPQLAQWTDTGLSDLVSASYDARAKVLEGDVTGAGKVAAVAAPVDRSWINYVAIGIAVTLAVCAVALVPIRMARKQSYQDYLRSKYYNL